MLQRLLACYSGLAACFRGSLALRLPQAYEHASVCLCACCQVCPSDLFFLVVWPIVPGSSLLPRFQVLAHCPFPPPHGDHAPQRGELHFPRALLVWPAGVAPCFWIGPLLGEVSVQC